MSNDERHQPYNDEETLYKYDPVYDVFYPINLDEELRTRQALALFLETSK